VNLSVGLIGLSFRTLSGLVGAELLPPPVVVDLQRGFADTLLRMVAGQHADLGDDLGLEDYQAVAVAKTGSLFRLGAWCGAMVGGASPDIAEGYGAFGEALGLLIQAWNDLYGLEGALGKEDVGHQRSLPILAALAMAGGSRASNKISIGTAEGEGGRLYALVQAELLHQQASDALDLCPAPGRLPLFLESYSTGQLLAEGRAQDG
jgi:geranylgeranyl pyrophosphate synthase